MMLDVLVRQQVAVLSTVRGFVDALRDIKDTNTERVNESVCVVINKWCHEPQVDTVEQAISAMICWINSLVDVMTQIDILEKKTETNSTSQTIPKAPAGLLSLRDYSVLQAAIEILFCWGSHREVHNGVLLPISQRRPNKTLGITTHVLEWAAQHPCKQNPQRLGTITQTLVHLLLLASLQPILLPKYIVDIVALIVYGDVIAVSSSKELHGLLWQVLPLRIRMASLRGALGQCNRSVTNHDKTILHSFTQRCGMLLSQMVMEPGGVVTTIELLLGSIEEGNTQARMQVAVLLCQCPRDIAMDRYTSTLCTQLVPLFTEQEPSVKVVRETAVLLIQEMVTRCQTTIMDREFIIPLLTPLLSYHECGMQGGHYAMEKQVAGCVAVLFALLANGPPPSLSLVQWLGVPCMRSLVHLYAFARTSKSGLTVPLETILIIFLRTMESKVMAILLQVCVLPTKDALPLRESLQHRDDPHLKPTPMIFVAGGSGGIAMRAIDPDKESEEIESFMHSVICSLVYILGNKELEQSAVVGELFTSLLLTYMQSRKSRENSDNSATKAKIEENEVAEVISQFKRLAQPKDVAGIQLLLTFLLGIIESLGASVLRSAETILQCIETVLSMYTHDKAPARLIDSINDPTENTQDDKDEDDEILTVCLGVVMTILEAGAKQRNPSEEAALKRMLPVLTLLSSRCRPQIAELASEACARILSRGLDPNSHSKKRANGKSFEDIIHEAEIDLQSPLVPLRARGVVLLTKMVRRTMQSKDRDSVVWRPRIEQLMAIYIHHLVDTESYVYLAAVQGLSTLADAHPSIAIPRLVSALRDTTLSFEKRIKLSEALLFTAKRCGETLAQYGKLFVYAYLECIQPPKQLSTGSHFSLIQELPVKPSSSVSSPQLVNATLRASCLSNLAEVCAMLQWALVPFATDVLTCVYGILEMEVAPIPEDHITTVRRGAVFVIKYILQLLGYKVIDILADQVKPIYHLLKHVHRVDRDEVVRFHAQAALDILNQIMRNELFASDETNCMGTKLHKMLHIVHR